MSVWLAASLCTVTAVVLTPFVGRLATSGSHWLQPMVPGVFALLLGLGAGALASDGVELFAFGLLAVAGAMLVAFDFAEHRLPDPIVAASYVALYPLLVLAAWLRDDWGSLGRAAIAGVGLFLLFLLMALIAPDGLGFGDVKLSGVLGGFLGWLGWAELAAGVFIGVLLNALAALLVLVLTRNRKAEVPFGPSLIAGAALGAWLGPQLLPGLA